MWYKKLAEYAGAVACVATLTWSVGQPSLDTHIRKVIAAEKVVRTPDYDRLKEELVGLEATVKDSTTLLRELDRAQSRLEEKADGIKTDISDIKRNVEWITKTLVAKPTAIKAVSDDVN